MDPHNHGRFGRVRHGELMSRLQETLCSEWVDGGCVADHVFIEQEEGTVAGPFRGPFGWYLSRLNERIRPARPLGSDDPKVRERLKEDYLRWAFVEYSREALAQAKVLGLESL
jgi:hypothetical protein